MTQNVDTNQVSTSNEKAIVHFGSFNKITDVSLLKTGFDLYSLPRNFMHNKSNPERIIYTALNSDMMKSPFASLKLACACADVIENFNVVTGIRVLKSIIKSALKSNKKLSLMIHNVAGTHVIDEFDTDAFLLAASTYSEWPFMKSLLDRLKINLDLADFSNNRLVLRNLYQRLLYHTVNQSPYILENDDESKCYELSSYEDNKQVLDKDPDTNNQNENNQVFFNTDFLRYAEWNLEDLSFLVGSDLAIFGTNAHPCISLKLNNHNETLKFLTGIDIWLENILNEVPEVAMFFHNEGIIMQEFEIYSTEEIPEMTGFNTEHIKSILRNLVMFIKNNATKEGHTYWLVRDADSDYVKLYDLSSISENSQDPSTNKSYKDNPFILPVASLCFKLAEYRMKQRDEYLSKAMNSYPKPDECQPKDSKSFFEEFLIDEESFVIDVMRLLKNCLNLLELVEGNRLTNANITDLKKRAASLLCRVYLSFNLALVSKCAKNIMSSTNNNYSLVKSFSMEKLVENGSTNLSAPPSCEEYAIIISACKPQNTDNKAVGDKFLMAFTSEDSSTITEMAIKFIEYETPISPTLYTPGRDAEIFSTSNTKSKVLQLYDPKQIRSWQQVVIKHQLVRSFSSLFLIIQQLEAKTIQYFRSNKSDSLTLFLSLKESFIESFLTYRVVVHSEAWKKLENENTSNCIFDFLNSPFKNSEMELFIGFQFSLAFVSFADLLVVSDFSEITSSNNDRIFGKLQSFCHLLDLDEPGFIRKTQNELETCLEGVPKSAVKLDITFRSREDFLSRFNQSKQYLDVLKMVLNLLVQIGFNDGKTFWKHHPEVKKLYPFLMNHLSTMINSFLNVVRFHCALVINSLPYKEELTSYWNEIIFWIHQCLEFVLNDLLKTNLFILHHESCSDFSSKFQHQFLYNSNVAQLCKLLHSTCGNNLFTPVEVDNFRITIIPLVSKSNVSSLHHFFLFFAIDFLYRNLESIQKDSAALMTNQEILNDLIRNTCQFLNIEVLFTEPLHFEKLVTSRSILDPILMHVERVIHLVPQTCWLQFFSNIPADDRGLTGQFGSLLLSFAKISLLAARKDTDLIKNSPNKFFSWEKLFKDLRLGIQIVSKRLKLFRNLFDIQELNVLLLSLYSYSMNIHTGMNEGILSINGYKSLIPIYSEISEFLENLSEENLSADNEILLEIKSSLDILCTDLLKICNYAQNKMKRDRKSKTKFSDSLNHIFPSVNNNDSSIREQIIGQKNTFRKLYQKFKVIF